LEEQHGRLHATIAALRGDVNATASIREREKFFDRFFPSGSIGRFARITRRLRFAFFKFLIDGGHAPISHQVLSCLDATSSKRASLKLIGT
jgi:hypothetical protein